MKTKTRVLLMTLCAVLLVAASVMGTMAYLTSSDKVDNTFTVGKVEIKLDEAALKEDGTVDADAERVHANSYKLLPGHTYNKDPMVTVLKGSEPSFIKMTVTITKADELDKIFPTLTANEAALTAIFGNYDEDTWLYQGNSEDTEANTRTYEFWYKTTVGAPTADVPLAPLFKTITVPGSIDNDQLKTIDGMHITVNAYAIQADGFSTAEAAWAAYDAANTPATE